MSCSGAQWNITLPQCVPDVECPLLVSPFMGVLSSNSTEFGTEVRFRTRTFTCSLVGTHTASCYNGGIPNY